MPNPHYQNMPPPIHRSSNQPPGSHYSQFKAARGQGSCFVLEAAHSRTFRRRQRFSDAAQPAEVQHDREPRSAAAATAAANDAAAPIVHPAASAVDAALPNTRSSLSRSIGIKRLPIADGPIFLSILFGLASDARTATASAITARPALSAKQRKWIGTDGVSSTAL